MALLVFLSSYIRILDVGHRPYFSGSAREGVTGTGNIKYP